MQLVESVEGGMRLERPDYWVVRVSFVAMSDAKFALFLRHVTDTLVEVVAEQAQATVYYAKKRKGATTLPEEMRYVNIAGGTRHGMKVAAAWAWVVQHGLEAYSSIVPGPLMRATLGFKLTHMPLSSSSTYTHLIGAMERAYEISKGMDEPDLELDLQGLPEPAFGNHSLRRQGDKVARDSMGKTGVTKETIDFQFGWLLKALMLDMQMHYAGCDRPARRGLAKVTMYY